MRSGENNASSTSNLFGRKMKRSTLLKAGLGAVGGAAVLGGGALAYASGDSSGKKETRAGVTVKKIADLTGNDNTIKFGVNGTDLGIPVVTPQGKNLYIFGDSYEGPKPTPEDANWRSPIGLFSGTTDLPSGLVFDGAIGGEVARQLWDYQHNNGEFSTVLPSDIITIGDTMFLQVMVHGEKLGDVLRSEIWSSKDEGESWQDTQARWAGDVHGGRMQQLTWALDDDDMVYVFSSRFDRSVGFILHRVHKDAIADTNAYEWWGWDEGTKKWDWNIGTPGEVWTQPTGEMCLRRLEGKWVMTWFNASQGKESIDGLVFDKPNDDLTKAHHKQLILNTPWGQEDDSHVAQLYGGYIIPGSTINDLHLVVSQWKTDDHSVYRSMQHRVQGLAD